jgi:hypothetical protein
MRKCVSVLALVLAISIVGHAQDKPDNQGKAKPENNGQANRPDIAQNKISGTLQCGKPESQHAIEVGDRPGHSLALGKSKCTWTKPLEIAGIQSKDGLSTAVNDVIGNTSRILVGYHITTMANSDTLFVRYEGRANLKDGVAQSEEGRWSFGSGNGKLKGLRGQGTYKCIPSGEGVTCEIEGGYVLPK